MGDAGELIEKLGLAGAISVGALFACAALIYYVMHRYNEDKPVKWPTWVLLVFCACVVVGGGLAWLSPKLAVEKPPELAAAIPAGEPLPRQAVTLPADEPVPPPASEKKETQPVAAPAPAKVAQSRQPSPERAVRQEATKQTPPSSSGFIQPIPIPPVVNALADWLRKPTVEEVGEFYPAGAREVPGRVTLRCRVDIRGALYACDVIDEAPLNSGFGAAALKMAGLFQMKPAVVNGLVKGGGTITIPVNFDPATRADR